MTWKDGRSVGGRSYRGGVLCTDREQLAYSIRDDARYTCNWIANFKYRRDDPSLPGVIGAARRYLDWCAAANHELLTNPEADPGEFEGAWRRHAVASNIVAVPYDIVTGFALMILAPIGLLALLTGSWVAAIGAFAGVGALVVYQVKATARLVVGPGARRTLVSTMTLNDLRRDVLW